MGALDVGPRDWRICYYKLCDDEVFQANRNESTTYTLIKRNAVNPWTSIVAEPTQR